MKTPSWISPLFWLAALYDGVLGLAFLAAHERLYASMNIPPPNHPGYIQFAAALLVVFAVGFSMVALDPVKNRGIILMGVGLKASYCGVVLGHWFAGSIPLVWTYFAWMDLGFLLAFIAAWSASRPGMRAVRAGLT